MYQDFMNTLYISWLINVLVSFLHIRLNEINWNWKKKNWKLLETCHHYRHTKPGKPANSPASYCPISLTSCSSKLFERLILNCLCYHLQSKNLLSPTQASFRPGRFTIDQVLLMSQSIWDDFQKKRPPDRTVLATIDFSKAFDSVWHSALFPRSSTLLCPMSFD